ncbi:hypothetical protein [Ferrimonas balearica]|uniref:hypothetical protein n=1 Tax=Ferrimonas balearica TaxID=44012 RepID=UPI001C991300|nr:hypothetical protein [Ferrimonas balearica]MBY5992402.1 hypothetical protein [Ferrimonas balearica]
MTQALATLHLSERRGQLHVYPELSLPKVPALLNGLDPKAVLDRLGLIYRQCGEAQRWAAVSLIEQHQGQTAKAVTQAARDQALALEWVTEHSWELWRIAHELLPPSLDRLTLLTRWRQALTERRDALCALHHLPGASVSPAALAPLTEWRGEWERQVLDPVQEAVSLKGWDKLFFTPADALCRWETGPAARLGMRHPTLGDRLEALWAELWQAADALTRPGALTGGGVQRPGEVPAARGTLTHQCLWQADRVSDYQIRIPTEGTLAAIAASLSGRPVPPQPDWRQGLAVWILAHAPCLEVAINEPETEEEREEQAHA